MQNEVEPDKNGGSGKPSQPALTKPSSVPSRSDDPVARTLRLEVSPATLLWLVIAGTSLWLVIRLWPVFLVLVVALFVLGTLSPAVQWLEEKRVRRGVGIAIVFTGVVIVAILLLTLTVPSIVAQAAAMFEREPVFRTDLANRLAQYHLSAPFADWLRNLRYGAPGNTVGATAFAYSMRIFEIAAYGMSAIFLALYMLIDRSRLRGGLFALVPRSHHIRLSRVMLNLETIVGAYIRGQLITSLLMGAFTFVLLTACGVENAMALAVFASIADVLPYIGAFLAVGPAVLAALGRSPMAAGIVLLVMLAYMEFENRAIIPRVYGHALRLPSSVVFFALIAGGTLMGILGAILALPVAATVMMLVEELRIDLPGEQEQVADMELRARDDLAEEEYERRTEGVAAQQAAAIAVEISVDRKREENHPSPPNVPDSRT